MKKRRHDSPSSLSSPSPSSSSPAPDRRKKPSRRRERSPLPRRKERDKKRRRKQQHSRRSKKRKISRRGRSISISSPTDRRRSSSSCSSRSIGRRRSRSRRRVDDDKIRSRGRRVRRRRSRDRSRLRNPSSCSLCCSSSSRSSDGGGERRSRRAKRSTVESKGRKHEDERVEIIQHYGDDPPSSRSVDSSDGAGKRDAGNLLLSNEAGGDLRGIDHADPGFGDDGDENPIPRLKSVVIVPAESSDEEEDDLEVLLRKKALANLRKFRRGNPRVDADSCSLDLNTRDVVQDDGSVKINQMALAEGVLVDIDPRKAGSNPDKAERSSSPFSGHTKRIAEAAEEKLLVRASVGDGLEDQIELGEKNAGQTADGPSADVDHDPRHKNDGGIKGAHRDSELESKTMTVMRGGEMVQVKYKVYIPKKAPSLARRQLKRFNFQLVQRIHRDIGTMNSLRVGSNG